MFIERIFSSGAWAFFRRPPVRIAIRLIVFVALISLPFLGASSYWTRNVMLLAMMALLASGLSLMLGYTGEMNLGQAAIYAVGAYITGWFARSILNDLAVCLVLSIVAAVVVGILAGAPGLRVGGWLLAILSLFLVILVPSVVNLVGVPIGGMSGLSGIPLPRLFGIKLSNSAFYVVVVVIAAFWFMVVSNLIHSRHGRAMLVVKESPVLAPTLGISSYAIKLKVYAIAAIPAGIAGTIFGYLDGYISPESFGLGTTVNILAAVVLGGAVSVWGAVIGAAIIVFVPQLFNGAQLWSTIVFGIVLVLCGVLFRGGFAGLIHSLSSRLRPHPEAGSLKESFDKGAKVTLPKVQGARLSIDHVDKHFGGAHVLRDVSAVAEPGRITALIGANGSGKTTLLNLISGLYRPDKSGGIHVDDEDVSDLRVHEISRLGVGRTF